MQPTAYLTFPLEFLCLKLTFSTPFKTNCPSIIFSISVNGNSFLSVAQVKNLGIVFDSFLLSHITINLQEILWFNFQYTSRIYTSYILYTPVQSIISPLLEFCNSMLVGLFPFSWAPFSLFAKQ